MKTMLRITAMVLLLGMVFSGCRIEKGENTKTEESVVETETESLDNIEESTGETESYVESTEEKSPEWISHFSVDEADTFIGWKAAGISNRLEHENYMFATIEELKGEINDRLDELETILVSILNCGDFWVWDNYYGSEAASPEENRRLLVTRTMEHFRGQFNAIASEGGEIGLDAFSNIVIPYSTAQTQLYCYFEWVELQTFLDKVKEAIRIANEQEELLWEYYSSWMRTPTE